MSKKDQCKEIMIRLFGPNTGSKVDAMGEEECVAKCKQLTMGFLGPDKAKEFDSIK